MGHVEQDVERPVMWRPKSFWILRTPKLLISGVAVASYICSSVATSHFRETLFGLSFVKSEPEILLSIKQVGKMW